MATRREQDQHARNGPEGPQEGSRQVPGGNTGGAVLELTGMALLAAARAWSRLPEDQRRSVTDLLVASGGMFDDGVLESGMRLSVRILQLAAVYGALANEEYEP